MNCHNEIRCGVSDGCPKHKTCIEDDTAKAGYVCGKIFLGLEELLSI